MPARTAIDPARKHHDAHRATDRPPPPVAGSVDGDVAGGGLLGGEALVAGTVVDVVVVAGVVLVVVACVVVVVNDVEVDVGVGIVVACVDVVVVACVVVVVGDVDVDVGAGTVVLVVLVVVVRGEVVVVVVAGGATASSARTSTDAPGAARRCEPGAEYVTAGPGPDVETTTALPTASGWTVATPARSVVAVTDVSPRSNSTVAPSIGPPGPRSTAVTATPASVLAPTSSSLHGPLRALASAESAATAASTSVSRPRPVTATTTRSPVHTGPPELRLAFA